MDAKWCHLLGFDATEATHQLAQVRPQFFSLYTPIFQADRFGCSTYEHASTYERGGDARRLA